MEAKVVSQDSPKLLDRLRAEIRVRHYSIRTEEAYVDWARRFIIFHNKRHPKDMGAEEVRDFLSHLATGRNVRLYPKSGQIRTVVPVPRGVAN